MDDKELLILIGDLESHRVERTASFTDGDKLRQAICAFANDLPDTRLPGVLFVGIRDDGSCAGVEVTDERLLALASMRSDGNITPFPSIIVEKRTLNGCAVAVVTVLPADAPPVRYKGRVWVRVGPRKAIASAEEERRLSEKRRWRDLPFDLRPVYSSAIDDLDLDLFQNEYLPSAVSRDILEQNQRTIEHQLASLRFVTSDKDPTPTVLGILVSGKEPASFVPGAYVQFLRVDGNALTDAIKDQRDVRGPMSEVLRMLDELFEAHVALATNVTDQHVEVRAPDYPIVAIQQIVRNAIMHRNYDGTNAPVRITWFRDQIEITNPGGPFGQVTKANFGSPGVTDYRNPHLAEALRNLGYVQKFGLGLQLARQELHKNGSPALEFQIEDSYVLATIRRRQ